MTTDPDSQSVTQTAGSSNRADGDITIGDIKQEINQHIYTVQEDKSPRRTFTAEVDGNIFKLEYIRVSAHFLNLGVFLDGVTLLKFQINGKDIDAQRITWGNRKFGPKEFDCIKYRKKREYYLDVYIKWSKIDLKLFVKDKKRKYGEYEEYELEELVTKLN